MARGEQVLKVAAPPEEVRARLAARTLRLGSIWFPTLAELRGWDSTTAPLYRRELAGGALELGPKLPSASAARFCPVVRVQVEGTVQGTALHLVRAWPRVTAGLLGLWGVLLVLWAVGLAWGPPEERIGGLFWWTVLLLGTVAAAGVGSWQGGAALDEALASLPSILDDPTAGEDDW